MPRPRSAARPRIFASCSATPSFASQRRTTTLERSIARTAEPTLANSIVVGGLRDLALAAEPGGVDEDVALVAALHERVDRVARGAGAVVDDHPLLAEDAVHQAGLAGVRLADDRDAREELVDACPAPCSPGSAATIARLELGHAAAVQRADRDRPCRRRGGRSRTRRRRAAASRPCSRRRARACPSCGAGSTATRSADVSGTIASRHEDDDVGLLDRRLRRGA